LIDEERVQLLLSWRHTGFSIHNSVVVESEDPAAVERLIRYVMRAPVALDRLEYDEAAGVVEIRPRPGSDDQSDGEGPGKVLVGGRDRLMERDSKCTDIAGKLSLGSSAHRRPVRPSACSHK
jgi:hypothetical protein